MINEEFHGYHETPAPHGNPSRSHGDGGCVIDDGGAGVIDHGRSREWVVEALVSGIEDPVAHTPGRNAPEEAAVPAASVAAAPAIAPSAVMQRW